MPHLLGIQFDGTIGIVEALLNDGGQFTNTLTFVAQHILSARREDDNLRARRRHAHLQCDRGDDSDGDRGMAGRIEKSGEERSVRGFNRDRGSVWNKASYVKANKGNDLPANGLSDSGAIITDESDLQEVIPPKTAAPTPTALIAE